MSDSGWPSPPPTTANGNPASALVPANGEIVATPSPSPVASNRLRLSTIADCKREIRRLYIGARNGELSSAEAGKLVWMISTLANLIADHDLEARLERLERK
jgi:hypothetical protein